MMPLQKSPCYKPSPYWDPWILNKTQIKKKMFKIVQPYDLLNASCAANIFQFLLHAIWGMVFCGKAKHVLAWLKEIKEERKFFDLIKGISNTLNTTQCSNH